jgi:membrane fusion protein (multidrug efflux system)
VPKAGKNLVFRVEAGVARAVPVKLGRREPGWVEVSGLRVGDVVVSDGQIKLKPGAPVSVGNPVGNPVGKPAGK